MLCLLFAFDGEGAQAAVSVGLVLLGLGIWTLAEYLIHRFGFHHVPGLRNAHLMHHADPAGLHGSPTVVTVLIFGLLALAPLVPRITSNVEIVSEATTTSGPPKVSLA